MVRTATVILNWRGAADTINCVLSIIAAKCPVDVFVVDNDSGDDSLSVIEAALSRAFNVKFGVEAAGEFALKRAQIEGGAVNLLSSGRNGGYSYGNNVGIRAAFEFFPYEFVWVLNNDICVLSRTSFEALLKKMDSSPEIGICGSTVVYASNVDLIQTRGGGSFSRWTGRSVPIGWNDHVSDPYDTDKIEQRLSYVNGAAMFIRSEVFLLVGCLEESYFLYYEELDIACRIKRHYSMGYAPLSILSHKVGASIGTSDGGVGSITSCLNLSRSRLLFLSRYAPWAIPFALADLIKIAVGQLIRRRPASAKATLLGILQFVFPNLRDRVRNSGGK